MKLCVALYLYTFTDRLNLFIAVPFQVAAVGVSSNTSFQKKGCESSHRNCVSQTAFSFPRMRKRWQLLKLPTNVLSSSTRLLGASKRSSILQVRQAFSFLASFTIYW